MMNGYSLAKVKLSINCKTIVIKNKGNKLNLIKGYILSKLDKLKRTR